MKDNTGPTKDLLQKALRTLPQDFSLREARQHISLALRNIEHVEQKRTKRATQDRQAVPATPNLPVYPAEALGIFDQLIDEENKKLEELQAKKEKNANNTPFTLLG